MKCISFCSFFFLYMMYTCNKFTAGWLPLKVFINFFPALPYFTRQFPKAWPQLITSHPPNKLCCPHPTCLPPSPPCSPLLPNHPLLTTPPPLRITFCTTSPVVVEPPLTTRAVEGKPHLTTQAVVASTTPPPVWCTHHPHPLRTTS